MNVPVPWSCFARGSFDVCGGVSLVCESECPVPKPAPMVARACAPKRPIVGHAIRAFGIRMDLDSRNTRFFGADSGRKICSDDHARALLPRLVGTYRRTSRLIPCFALGSPMRRFRAEGGVRSSSGVSPRERY